MSIYATLRAEANQRLRQESLSRILHCLDLITVDQIWYHPNDNVNSIGNLVLHLSGNIRQYCCHGIGGQQDYRDRNAEFIPKQGLSKEVLFKLINTVVDDALSAIGEQSDLAWSDQITVQCFDMTKLSALIHVIEHTSYHVGQITQMTKWLADVDTGYYADLKLD